MATDSPPMVEGLGFDLASLLGPVSDYPRFAYPMKAVRRVGERLSEKIILLRDASPEEREHVFETFAIASSWRDSHIYPMRSVRFSVRHCMRALDLKGNMASRPKRMSSIRRKLRDTSTKFDQMNDLGGCRAIMDNIGGVRALLDFLNDKFPHTIRQNYPYIDAPKPDGCRSHHVVVTFNPRSVEQEAFADRRNELQVRTRLQHAWATAVEAMGLYRGEDFKHGAGDPNWLRLFQLASAEFAYAEDCQTADNMPDHFRRVSELRELNGRLGATKVLEDIKNATHYAESYIYVRQPYYLIRYRKDHTVTVESFGSAITGAAALGQVENMIEMGDDDEKVALVEVDKVDRLIDTYPNYFGDVSLFVANLRSICEGKRAVEYSMAPQKMVSPKPHERPDPSLLYRRYTQWTERGGMRPKP